MAYGSYVGVYIECCLGECRTLSGNCRGNVREFQSVWRVLTLYYCPYYGHSVFVFQCIIRSCNACAIDTRILTYLQVYSTCKLIGKKVKQNYVHICWPSTAALLVFLHTMNLGTSGMSLAMGSLNLTSRSKDHVSAVVWSYACVGPAPPVGAAAVSWSIVACARNAILGRLSQLKNPVIELGEDSWRPNLSLAWFTVSPCVRGLNRQPSECNNY